MLLGEYSKSMMKNNSRKTRRITNGWITLLRPYMEYSKRGT
jgi:hypothetical protein